MEIHIHIHHHQENESKIIHILNQIQMTNAELKDLLIAANGKVDKVKTEIQALKDLVAASENVPQDVVDAVNALGTNLQAADDLNPDA
jgi:chromosome segregation ATPase